MKTLII